MGEFISTHSPADRGLRRLDTTYLPAKETVVGKLRQHIVGQDEAVGVVAAAILRAGSGFVDPNKPVGSFMFLGQTGVGKTEMAKATAQALFGDKWEDHFQRIDCTTLQESQDIKRLQGSQPEYVGYGDPLLITPEFLSQPGGNVIVFDEIEKAHPKVWRLLLSILGEGEMTVYAPTKNTNPKDLNKSAAPIALNFRGSYIFFTSNIGAEALSKSRTPRVGFRSNSTDARNREDTKPLMMRELRATFSSIPELLGRIGESNFVVFNSLSPEDYAQIFDMVMIDVNNNQKGNKTNIEVTPELKAWLIKKAVGSGEYGAREIQDIVNKYVLTKASEAKVSGALTDGDSLILHLEDDEEISLYTKDPGSIPTEKADAVGVSTTNSVSTSVEEASRNAREKRTIETDRNTEFEIHPSFDLKENSPGGIPVERIELLVHNLGVGYVEISESKPSDGSTIFVSEKARRYRLGFRIRSSLAKTPLLTLIFSDNKYHGVNKIMEIDKVRVVDVNTWRNQKTGKKSVLVFDKSDFDNLLVVASRSKGRGNT